MLKMKITLGENSGLVYSTQTGEMCPFCNKQIKNCICKQNKSAPKTTGPAKVAKSTKGRRGKVVTIITNLPLAPDELKKLATQLKQKCGCGGTAKDGTIEIQGDHVEKLKKEIKAKGF